MKYNEVIRRSAWIVEDAGLDDVALNATNFLDYADLVRDVLSEWPRDKQDANPWLLDYAKSLRVMRDSFDRIVAADPMVLYKPAHQVALEFHQSLARTRYFRASNRCSKTQAGVADNYWVATGQHPWRPRPPLPSSVGIVGVNFSKYCPTVFETKYLDGEPGNPLSPVFPENGRWFNHYDPRKHIITIACPQCADDGKAQSCSHPKSYIILFSDIEGPVVIAGGQYAQLQFDEQVGEGFLGEGLKRLNTVPNSGLIVTETPLGGKAFWTHRILTRDARAGKKVGSTNQPLCSLHTIDQFSAGLTSHDIIRADMEMMSKAEIECRIYGRPAAFSDSGVFDAFTLDKMNDEVVAPTRGTLLFDAERNGEDPLVVLSTLMPGDMPTFIEDEIGDLRVWHKPDPEKQYIIGADVAQGLIDGDASCAQVLEMSMVGYVMMLRQVASLHAWINPETYADATMRLACWYNEAMIVPERNGPGHEMIRRLKTLGYWNIFRDVSDTAQVEFATDPTYGIVTSPQNKGAMIAVLQQCVRDRKTGARTVIIYDEETLEEMGCYEQAKTDKGNVTFAGTGGTHDDRVMGLVIAAYAAKAFSAYDFNKDIELKRKAAEASLSQEERETWSSIREMVSEYA